MLPVSRSAFIRCTRSTTAIQQIHTRRPPPSLPRLSAGPSRPSSTSASPPLSSSSHAQIQRRLADRFIQGYNDLSIPSLLAPRAKECEHHVLPANLQRPVRGNSEYAALFAPLIPHLKDFEMTAHRFVNDPEAKTIAVYATGSATTPWGPYENSYVFFLTCDWEREEVVRVEEFLDSKFSGEFFERMKVWKEREQTRGRE